ncbi:alpha/beta hydrolase [Deinococcus radiophilus]|uniref:alpha/beta hydrolase n=1 Tax=Deinococcus radiophilus TaxID=32062 RepID=UPI001E633475|nr:alpha/beta fold hydrolase [Deinococcus radiophilus]UFA50475.1 alpha/beta fold hydrolase [Deinococcus radiophilus]
MNIRQHFRLQNLPRTLAVAFAAYLAAIFLGALVGAEVLLRSKSRWIKGTFMVVGRRGENVVLPPLPESLSRDVLGVVPLNPVRGHALVGPVERRSPYVERPVLEERGVIQSGWIAWVSSFVYNGTPAQLDVEYENVVVHTDIGDLPAWHIPAESGERDLIVIQIHGHGGQRSQSLRVLKSLQRTGAAQLYVTFRNAFDAPRVGKGYLSLGDVEAEDVLSALEWARDNGYRQAVLMGYSMGGNIALSALRPGFTPHPIPVRGVVLDSPALEWRDILRRQARRGGLPQVVAKPVGRMIEKIVTRRSGQNFSSVDQLAAAPRFDVPILLFHSPSDKTVPFWQAKALAGARPDLVELHAVEGARHIRCWNIDPERYEAALEAFIQRVKA